MLLPHVHHPQENAAYSALRLCLISFLYHPPKSLWSSSQFFKKRQKNKCKNKKQKNQGRRRSSMEGKEDNVCDDEGGAMRRGAQPVHLTFLGKTREGALPPHDDVVLWLATENEFMRRAFKNDRATIAKLRAQLHTAKRALRTLHTQGVGGSENGTSEEQHRCLVSQLSNLDRLALDWARRCEALDGEARELCQLRIEHANVLEASQALRAAHEATICSLKSELERALLHSNLAECKAASLLSARNELELKVAAQVAAVELEIEGNVTNLERQLHSMQLVISSLEGAVPPRMQRLQQDVAGLRADFCAQAEARRQRDVQVHVKCMLITAVH
jgi:hypothetical protein